MSTFYKENNRETAFELFNKRAVYKLNSRNDQYSNLTDFIAEKLMYGRVDRFLVPMIIPEDSTNFKYFSSNSNSSQGLKALNFVVDAFSDLQQQFKKCLLMGKIDGSDQYLSNLKVYKAYESPFFLYNSYVNRFYSALRSASDIDTKRLADFNMLIDNLLKSLESSDQRNALTFPAYVKSRKAPISISGLSIEIADLDYSNDEEKVNNFIKSKNWNFFLNTCKSYGFMVDLNNPWRLVADIGSQPMIEYASKYGYTDTNSIIFNYYRKASYFYYNTFINRMREMYNTVKPTSIEKITECNGNTLVKYIKPKDYISDQILQESYGQEQFLMLYCKLRFIEEESEYPKYKKDNILRDMISISKIKGESKAIEQFERFLNETLDYQGSLSYYVDKSRTEEQEEINQTTRY